MTAQPDPADEPEPIPDGLALEEDEDGSLVGVPTWKARILRAPLGRILAGGPGATADWFASVFLREIRWLQLCAALLVLLLLAAGLVYFEVRAVSSELAAIRSILALR